MATTAEHWDERYSERARMWGGNVNASLAGVVDGLVPGRALDLGCGEGGDAIWLARQGWQVTAVDVSEIALERAGEDAAEAGVADRIAFHVADLEHDFPDGRYDLVSAAFLHSQLEFDRVQILRRAAEAVAPGGLLLIIEHAEAPPWAQHHHHDRFATAQESHAALNLPEADWTVLEVGTRDRVGTGPDHHQAELADNVIALRRNG